MTNIFATANEITDITQRGYVEIYKKYLSTDSPFDLIIMADVFKLNPDLFNKCLFYYKLEHANLVETIQNYSVKTVVADVAMVEEKNMRLRHSEEKLGKLFSTLVL